MTIYSPQEFQVSNIINFIGLQEKNSGRSFKSLIKISGDKLPDLNNLMIKMNLLKPFVLDLLYQGDKSLSMKRLSP